MKLFRFFFILCAAIELQTLTISTTKSNTVEKRHASLNEALKKSDQSTLYICNFITNNVMLTNCFLNVSEIFSFCSLIVITFRFGFFSESDMSV